MIKQLGIICLLMLFGSCERLLMEGNPEDTPENNFNTLWTNLDRKYSYFGYKNIDWDSIYRVYHPMITPRMSERDLYDVLNGMLMELRDGHTNISSVFGSEYYNYYHDYPGNFDQDLLFNYYLKTDYTQINSVYYKEMDSCGYIYIPDFSMEITVETVDEIMSEFKEMKGVIIDVRGNGGGNDLYAGRMVRRFFDKERLVENLYIKTGPGHNSFTSVSLSKSPAGDYQFLKPVAVLTNRKVFSAANSFVCWLSVLPHVAVIGDTTGGGAGTPYNSELPNGWIYRYSSNQLYRIDGLNLDRGIPPDHNVSLNTEEADKGRDSIIEYALQWIKSQ